jgi:prepilin-type processing-associated H-X9-DG protein
VQIKRSEIAAAVLIVGFIAAVIVLGVYPALRAAPLNQCTTNLQNVATAISLYAGDNGAYMVRAENWTEVLVPRYMDSLTSLVCPTAQPTAEQLAAYKGEGVMSVPIGYALFAPLAGARSNFLADSAKTPALFDSSEFRPNATSDLSTLDFRHSGKLAAVVYVDGHAATLTAAPAVPEPLLSDKPAPPPAASGGDHGEDDGHGH